MAKGKKEDTEESTSLVSKDFEGFKLLRGEFIDPPEDGSLEEELIENNEQKDSKKIEKNKTSKKEEEITEEERLAAGDKLLEEATKKQAKALKKSEETLNEESEEESEEVEEQENKESLFKAFVKDLNKKGVIDFDDSDEDFEDSEEGANKLVSKTIDYRINKWVEQLPDDFKKLLEFTQNGGKTKDFLDVFYGKQSWENFTIDSEVNQKAVVAESLRMADYSEDEINDIVEEYSENGTLEKRAKAALPKVQKFENQQKENIIKSQKEYALKQKEIEQEYWNNFKKDLYSREDIKGFKITPKVKDNLWEHMTNVNPKTGKTAYQEAIENDREASLLFALQSMNKFDITKLEKQVETKVSNNFGKLLKQYSKSSKEKISSGIADERTQENPFEGFKVLKTS